MNEFKILHIPDIHLYDIEVGCSVGYPEQSVKILEEIKEEFIVGEYDIITLGGDIQHAKLTMTKYISKFFKMMQEIGKLVRKRLEERDLLELLEVYDGKLVRIDLKEMESILFTVKGQHDKNVNEKFTFFDMLEENNVIINPSIIKINKTQINFFNYTRKVSELKKQKLEGIKSLIAIFHNPIMENGVHLDTIIGKVINPLEHGIYDNVDLAIVNDIHMQLPVREVNNMGHKTVIITPGSLGRTSFNKSHDRDIGNMIAITINEESEIECELIEMELIPAEEFFNKHEIVKKKIRENAFKDFSMEVENVKLGYFDIVEEINKKVPEEDIREICLFIVEMDTKR